MGVIEPPLDDAPKNSPEAPPLPEGSETASILTLQAPEEAPPPSISAELKRATVQNYKKTYAEYAALLGIANKDATRKIKTWVKRGRENEDGTPRETPDLPPFDELPQMASWWRRNMKWRVPDYLARFELDPAAESTPPSGGGTPPPTGTQAGQEEPAGTNAAYGSLDLVGMDDMGADMGLRQARAMVNSTFEAMQAAMKLKQLQQYQTLRREWQQLVQTLRQWEKDIVKIQEGKGEVLRTRVLLADMNRLFAMISTSFSNALSDIVLQVAPQIPPGERREIVLAHRDKIFEHLQTTRFSAAWTPPPVA